MKVEGKVGLLKRCGEGGTKVPSTLSKKIMVHFLLHVSVCYEE